MHWADQWRSTIDGETRVASRRTPCIISSLCRRLFFSVALRAFRICEKIVQAT